MAGLPKTNPALYQEYLSAKRWNDCLSVFFRESGAYPYTGVSRVNLYSIFAEQYESLINSNGATGNVLPSGIVLDNNNFSVLFNNKKKNQYNHMRKSVNNMLRLQNDKAVCMPTDTRIQILT